MTQYMDLTKISDDAFSLILSHLETADQIALRQCSSSLKKKIERIAKKRLEWAPLIEEKGFVPTMRHWGPLHDLLKPLPDAFRKRLWQILRPPSMTARVSGGTVELSAIGDRSRLRVLCWDRGFIRTFGPADEPVTWYRYETIRHIGDEPRFVGEVVEDTTELVDEVTSIMNSEPREVPITMNLPEEVRSGTLLNADDPNMQEVLRMDRYFRRALAEGPPEDLFIIVRAGALLLLCGLVLAYSTYWIGKRHNVWQVKHG